MNLKLVTLVQIECCVYVTSFRSADRIWLFDPDILVELKIFDQSTLPNKFLILVHVEDVLFCSSSSFQLDIDHTDSVFRLQSILKVYLF